MNDTITFVYGERFDAIFVNGHRLDPARSLELFNHSPDGFAWGYGGSGPAQAALAILLACGVADEEAVRLHQDFKTEFVMGVPEADTVVRVDVRQWARMRDPSYVPSLGEAAADPDGFVAGMEERS